MIKTNLHCQWMRVKKINPYVNKYVFSKFLSEQIVEYYKDLVPSIIIRLSNIYGYTKLNRPDLIPTIMQDIFEKEKVEIWSNKPKEILFLLKTLLMLY